jgi:hypothetical protein
MKVRIEHLGALHEAEIELKPLTVFVGPNNTGKTWTVYTIAALLGEFGRQRYTKAYVSGESTDSYPSLDAAIKQLVEEGNAKIDLVEFFNKYGSYYMNNVAVRIPQWMQTFLGTQYASFDDLELFIDLSEQESQNIAPKIILEFPHSAKLSVGKGGDALLNAVKKPGDPILYFYTKGVGGIIEKLPLEIIKEFVAETVFRGVNKAFYPRVFYFAAERTSLVSFACSAKRIEREELPDEDDGKEPNSSGIALSEPSSGLMNIIAEAKFEGSVKKRNDQAKKDPNIANYLKLAELLQAILGGRLDFSKPEPDLERELLFKYLIDEPIILDLPVVSSMVKDLSPLVLYLQYIARPRDLLVIDEPEMNLHPKAQAELTEFLAILVNAGLRVLITTHSPYVVDHLTNLMKAYKHEDKENIQKKFYLKRIDAFISQDDVSVYLFDKNTAKNVLDKEGLIDWDTFSSESERISQLFFELEGD